MARQVRSQELATPLTPHLGNLAQRRKARTWCWPQGGAWDMVARLLRVRGQTVWEFEKDLNPK